MKTTAKSGYTILEMMIVVAIIGLLAGIAIPMYLKHRDSARISTIYNNLRILEAAKDQWAVETNQRNGADVPNVSVVSNYITSGNIKTVINEEYVPNPVGVPAGAQLPSGTPLGTFQAGAFIPLPSD